MFMTDNVKYCWKSYIDYHYIVYSANKVLLAKQENNTLLEDIKNTQ